MSDTPPFKFKVGQQVIVRPNPDHMIMDWVNIINNSCGTIMSRTLVKGDNKYKVINGGRTVRDGNYPDKNNYEVKFSSPIQLEVRLSMDTMHFDEDELFKLKSMD